MRMLEGVKPAKSTDEILVVGIAVEKMQSRHLILGGCRGYW